MPPPRAPPCAPWFGGPDPPGTGKWGTARPRAAARPPPPSDGGGQHRLHDPSAARGRTVGSHRRDRAVDGTDVPHRHGGSGRHECRPHKSRRRLRDAGRVHPHLLLSTAYRPAGNGSPEANSRGTNGSALAAPSRRLSPTSAGVRTTAGTWNGPTRTALSSSALVQRPTSGGRTRRRHSVESTSSAPIPSWSSWPRRLSMPRPRFIWHRTSRTARGGGDDTSCAREVPYQRLTAGSLTARSIRPRGQPRAAPGRPWATWGPRPAVSPGGRPAGCPWTAAPLRCCRRGARPPTRPGRAAGTRCCCRR